MVIVVSNYLVKSVPLLNMHVVSIMCKTCSSLSGGNKHALSMDAKLNKGISAVASDSLSEMIPNLNNEIHATVADIDVVIQPSRASGPASSLQHHLMLSLIC